ncbi:MAG TPA: sulfotransferase [Rhizomicrobium sp.]|nr:sulfotransferase [Rhizomicrobium sp.]
MDRARDPLGPDFLCVGMPKSGTAWLGDQLRRHPQFWMPPVQELGYLGRDAPPLRSANRRLERIRCRTERRKSTKPSNKNGDADICFLEEIAACTGQPRNIETYISLFRHKGSERISGDISPGYGALEGPVIQQLHERLPGLNALLLVRDPVERLWSHINMWHRNGKFDPAVSSNLPDFRAYLERAKMPNEGSSPTKIVAHWSRILPAGRFRYFFFDDIVARPEFVRGEILAFLGADPNLGSGDLPAGYNRKSQSAKLLLTEAIKAVLIEHCAAEIRACAVELGGCATAWPARYGL